MYVLNAAATGHQPRFRPEIAPEPSLENIFFGQPAETFAPGQAVFWHADPAKDVFEIRKGVIRLYRILQDGKRVIAGFIFPGDMLGVDYRGRYVFTAEAVTEVILRRLPRSRFDSVVSESPELRSAVLTKLSDDMCAAQDQMLLLLHHSAEARVANFLLTLARKMNGRADKGAEVEVTMSRSDIADYLGLTVETTCRCMSKLKADGLITLFGPYRIVLNEPRALKELTGEEPKVIAAVWPR
jgi:CRP/FNR family transcriptional regulator, anaerobic regulatory protein